MLRDITIGQHFPGNSLVHRFDPRLKLVLTVAYIVLLFAASNPFGAYFVHPLFWGSCTRWQKFRSR